MRNHDTLTKALIVLSSFFVLSCQHVELPETQQHKIVASVGAYNTKANFHMTETPNVLCEWNGRETLRVYYKRSNGKYHSTFANAPVARVEEEGKSADFTFSPEQAWGFNGNVSSYPVAIFTVNCFPTIDPEDGSIYLDARLVRQPLKDFELPVYYVGEVVNGTVEATFSHYYAYEFLHVKNTSDKTIEFSLNGYETPWIWYKKLASVGLEDGVVYNKSWSGLTPAEVSYPVSIAPGSSDIIVSAYIPNDFIVKDAAIVAAIDGIIVKSTNKKSSAAPLVPGRAYHMYAGWNGQELRFWDDGEEPLDVRTLTASIDPQYLSGEFTGVVANPPMSEIKTGFRFWKENNTEDYVEYDSTSSDNGSFSLNLKYDDFVYIANESPVEGKYFVSAFAIDAKGTRHPGNVLEFTIENGQPVVPIIPDAVDLGLSVKWASFNVGATKPEEYGGHYAWGEIEEKTAYDWSTYKWSDGDSNRLIKYCTESTDGHIDGKTTLDLDDDVAHVCFGDNWRMPTKSELDELIQKCTWRWTTKNGVSGYEVTGANGNSVFLPSAGVRDNSNHGGTDPLTGQYWSSTLCDEMTSIDSHYLYCGSNDYLLSDASRYRGLSVRPVYDDSDQKPEIKTPEIVDLGLSVKWASFNLGATKPEEYGDYFAWGATEPYYSCLDPLIWKNGKETGYSWTSYQWCMNGSDHALTKYCTDSQYGYNGFTDDKTTLEQENDAVYVNLGGKWRIPTYTEWTEMEEKCTWTWTSVNGLYGREVTGPNGKSIFLPAAGYWHDSIHNDTGSNGYYWTSSLYPASMVAWSGDIDSDWVHTIGYFRRNGLSIRPVYDDSSKMPEIEVSPTDIEFGAVPYGTSSTKYVTVKNIGSGVLSFTVENVSAPFSVTPTRYSLSAGESVQLAFTYTPVSATSGAGGRCTIVSNATQSVVSVTYSGSGTESGVSTPEAIDLGLPSGLKWASFNIGASKPEEYGDYYAWGEVEPYYSSLNPLTWKEGKEAGYNWPSYKWCMGSNTTLTKYCNQSSCGYNGFTDNKTVLDSEDDAAHVNLGGNWRMPTKAEWGELMENCTWTWTRQNGVRGKLVTAKNGNSIFLPAAALLSWTGFIYEGDGYYWSSSMSSAGQAWIVTYIGYLNSVHLVGNQWCHDGSPIRPVYDDSEPKPENKAPEPVDLGLPSGLKWASFNLGATKPEEYGDYFAWGETEPKADYSWATYKWCMGSKNTLTKYCTRSEYGYNGFTDEKTVLDPEDDAAHVILGGNWRMPTKEEQDELRNKCSWEWTQVNGVNGQMVTGPNGNSIFLPAACDPSLVYPEYVDSYGGYWSCSLYTSDPDFESYQILFFPYGTGWSYNDRFIGFSVRPVSE